jgi:hypothetical protein
MLSGVKRAAGKPPIGAIDSAAMYSLAFVCDEIRTTPICASDERNDTNTFGVNQFKCRNTDDDSGRIRRLSAMG